MVIEYREVDDSETTVEFRFAKDLGEQLCDMRWGIPEGSATKGTEHKGIVAVVSSDAQNRADLLARGFDERIDDAQAFRPDDKFGTVYRRDRNYRGAERSL